MTADEAMEIGMKIAENHKKNVMQLVNELGSSAESALHGCVVSLAADIMCALQEVSKR